MLLKVLHICNICRFMFVVTRVNVVNNCKCLMGSQERLSGMYFEQALLF